VETSGGVPNLRVSGGGWQRPSGRVGRRQVIALVEKQTRRHIRAKRESSRLPVLPLAGQVC